MEPHCRNNRYVEKQVKAVQKLQTHLLMATANVSDIGVTLRMALQAPIKFRKSMRISLGFRSKHQHLK